MYQNMLDRASPLRGTYKVKIDSTDDWIIVTKTSFTGVYIWHQFHHDAIELAFDGDRRGIVGGKVPPGSEDRFAGNVSFSQYRWNISPIDTTLPPFTQPGVHEAIERTLWAFRWVRDNKVA